MSFRDVVARAWDQNIPLTALFELTYACNLDCVFCYNDLDLRGQRLQLDDYDRLFRELRDLQTLTIILSGGEPLAHPNFFEIGRRARDFGFFIRLKSNGHGLRGRVARRVQEEVAPYLIEVSLHGARPETHDRQTRVPGSFERLRSNVRELKDLGARVQFNSTMTAWNADELPAMFDLADELGCRLQVDPVVSARDNGDLEPTKLQASPSDRARLLAIERSRSRASHPTAAEPDGDDAPPTPAKHCGAGSSTLAIDPFGNVYPCVSWRWHLGNVHEHSLTEIWRGETSEEVRDTTTRIAREIASRPGPDRPQGYCPGAAASRRSAGGSAALPILQGSSGPG